MLFGELEEDRDLVELQCLEDDNSAVVGLLLLLNLVMGMRGLRI